MISILYLYSPLYYKLNPYQAELDNLKGEYAAMSENFAIGKSIITENEEYIKKIDELDFNSELSYEYIIAILNNCTAKNNIIISNIKFSESEDGFISEDIDVVESDSETENNLQILNVVVEFKLKFDELLSFIDDVKGYGNDICVTGIHVISWDEDRVFAVIDMKFYAVTMPVVS